MSDVKWIKINTDIFDDDKFKLIDAMPEADAIELIWFKLLVFAGKSNNNGIFFFNDRIAYTDEMLATVFNRPLNVVRLALNTFKEFEMIEDIEGVYTIANWSKHQSLDSYEKKKERDKEYQRKRRSERKQAIEEKSSENRLTVGRFCSYSISSSISSSNSDSISLITKDIIDYLNNKLGSNYRYQSTKTQGLVKARLNEGYGVDDFKTVIDKKFNDWANDSKMRNYLRPETLFSNKFEGYLNQQDVEEKSEEQKYIERWQDV